MSTLKDKIFNYFSSDKQERERLIELLLTATISVIQGAEYAYQEDSVTLGEHIYSVWCDVFGNLATFSCLPIKEKDDLNYQVFANEETGKYERTFASPAGDIIAYTYFDSSGDWNFDSDLSNQEIVGVLRDFSLV